MSYVSPAPVDVGKAISTLAAGDVGSVGMFAVFSALTYVASNAIIAGSNLRWANAYAGPGSATQNGAGPLAPTGSWRCLGHTSVYNGTGYQTSNNKDVTCFVRVA